MTCGQGSAAVLVAGAEAAFAASATGGCGGSLFATGQRQLAGEYFSEFPEAAGVQSRGPAGADVEACARFVQVVPVEIDVLQDQSFRLGQPLEPFFDSVQGLVLLGDGLKVGQTVVRVDPRYFRPNELESLIGDASKASEELSWSPQTSFGELVRLMVESDLKAAERESTL